MKPVQIIKNFKKPETETYNSLDIKHAWDSKIRNVQCIVFQIKKQNVTGVFFQFQKYFIYEILLEISQKIYDLCTFDSERTFLENIFEKIYKIVKNGVHFIYSKNKLSLIIDKNNIIFEFPSIFSVNIFLRYLISRICHFFQNISLSTGNKRIENIFVILEDKNYNTAMFFETRAESAVLFRIYYKFLFNMKFVMFSYDSTNKGILEKDALYKHKFGHIRGYFISENKYKIFLKAKYDHYNHKYCHIANLRGNGIVFLKSVKNQRKKHEFNTNFLKNNIFEKKIMHHNKYLSEDYNTFIFKIILRTNQPYIHKITLSYAEKYYTIFFIDMHDFFDQKHTRQPIKNVLIMNQLMIVKVVRYDAHDLKNFHNIIDKILEIVAIKSFISDSKDTCFLTMHEKFDNFALKSYNDANSTKKYLEVNYISSFNQSHKKAHKEAFLSFNIIISGTNFFQIQHLETSLVRVCFKKITSSIFLFMENPYIKILFVLSNKIFQIYKGVKHLTQPRKMFRICFNQNALSSLTSNVILEIIQNLAKLSRNIMYLEFSRLRKISQGLLQETNIFYFHYEKNNLVFFMLKYHKDVDNKLGKDFVSNLVIYSSYYSFKIQNGITFYGNYIYLQEFNKKSFMEQFINHKKYFLCIKRFIRELHETHKISKMEKILEDHKILNIYTDSYPRKPQRSKNISIFFLKYIRIIKILKLRNRQVYTQLLRNAHRYIPFLRNTPNFPLLLRNSHEFISFLRYTHGFHQCLKNTPASFLLLRNAHSFYQCLKNKPESSLLLRSAPDSYIFSIKREKENRSGIVFRNMNNIINISFFKNEIHLEFCFIKEHYRLFRKFSASQKTLSKYKNVKIHKCDITTKSKNIYFDDENKFVSIFKKYIVRQLEWVLGDYHICKFALLLTTIQILNLVIIALNQIFCLYFLNQHRIAYILNKNLELGFLLYHNIKNKKVKNMNILLQKSDICLSVRVYAKISEKKSITSVNISNRHRECGIFQEMYIYFAKHLSSHLIIVKITNYFFILIGFKMKPNTIFQKKKSRFILQLGAKSNHSKRVQNLMHLMVKDEKYKLGSLRFNWLDLDCLKINFFKNPWCYFTKSSHYYLHEFNVFKILHHNTFTYIFKAQNLKNLCIFSIILPLKNIVQKNHKHKQKTIPNIYKNNIIEAEYTFEKKFEELAYVSTFYIFFTKGIFFYKTKNGSIFILDQTISLQFDKMLICTRKTNTITNEFILDQIISLHPDKILISTRKTNTMTNGSISDQIIYLEPDKMLISTRKTNTMTNGSISDQIISLEPDKMLISTRKTHTMTNGSILDQFISLQLSKMSIFSRKTNNIANGPILDQIIYLHHYEILMSAKRTNNVANECISVKRESTTNASYFLCPINFGYVILRKYTIKPHPIIIQVSFCDFNMPSLRIIENPNLSINYTKADRILEISVFKIHMPNPPNIDMFQEFEYQKQISNHKTTFFSALTNISLIYLKTLFITDYKKVVHIYGQNFCTKGAMKEILQIISSQNRGCCFVLIKLNLFKILINIPSITKHTNFAEERSIFMTFLKIKNIRVKIAINEDFLNGSIYNFVILQKTLGGDTNCVQIPFKQYKINSKIFMDEIHLYLKNVEIWMSEFEIMLLTRNKTLKNTNIRIKNKKWSYLIVHLTFKTIYSKQNLMKIHFQSKRMVLLDKNGNVSNKMRYIFSRSSLLFFNIKCTSVSRTKILIQISQKHKAPLQHYRSTSCLYYIQIFLLFKRQKTLLFEKTSLQRENLFYKKYNLENKQYQKMINIYKSQIISNVFEFDVFKKFTLDSFICFNQKYIRFDRNIIRYQNNHIVFDLLYLIILRDEMINRKNLTYFFKKKSNNKKNLNYFIAIAYNGEMHFSKEYGLFENKNVKHHFENTYKNGFYFLKEYIFFENKKANHHFEKTYNEEISFLKEYGIFGNKNVKHHFEKSYNSEMFFFKVFDLCISKDFNYHMKKKYDDEMYFLVGFWFLRQISVKHLIEKINHYKNHTKTMTVPKTTDIFQKDFKSKIILKNFVEVDWKSRNLHSDFFVRNGFKKIVLHDKQKSQKNNSFEKQTTFLDIIRVFYRMFYSEESVLDVSFWENINKLKNVMSIKNLKKQNYEKTCETCNKQIYNSQISEKHKDCSKLVSARNKKSIYLIKLYCGEFESQNYHFLHKSQEIFFLDQKSKNVQKYFSKLSFDQKKLIKNLPEISDQIECQHKKYFKKDQMKMVETNLSNIISPKEIKRKFNEENVLEKFLGVLDNGFSFQNQIFFRKRPLKNRNTSFNMQNCKNESNFYDGRNSNVFKNLMKTNHFPNIEYLFRFKGGYLLGGSPNENAYSTDSGSTKTKKTSEDSGSERIDTNPQLSKKNNMQIDKKSGQIIDRFWKKYTTQSEKSDAVHQELNSSVINLKENLTDNISDLKKNKGGMYDFEDSKYSKKTKDTNSTLQKFNMESKMDLGSIDTKLKLKISSDSFNNDRIDLKSHKNYHFNTKEVTENKINHLSLQTRHESMPKPDKYSEKTYLGSQKNSCMYYKVNTDSKKPLSSFIIDVGKNKEINFNRKILTKPENNSIFKIKIQSYSENIGKNHVSDSNSTSKLQDLKFSSTALPSHFDQKSCMSYENTSLDSKNTKKNHQEFQVCEEKSKYFTTHSYDSLLTPINTHQSFDKNLENFDLNNQSFNKKSDVNKDNSNFSQSASETIKYSVLSGEINTQNDDIHASDRLTSKNINDKACSPSNKDEIKMSSILQKTKNSLEYLKFEKSKEKKNLDCFSNHSKKQDEPSLYDKKTNYFTENYLKDNDSLYNSQSKKSPKFQNENNNASFFDNNNTSTNYFSNNQDEFSIASSAYPSINTNLDSNIFLSKESDTCPFNSSTNQIHLKENLKGTDLSCMTLSSFAGEHLNATRNNKSVNIPNPNIRLKVDSYSKLSFVSGSEAIETNTTEFSVETKPNLEISKTILNNEISNQQENNSSADSKIKKTCYTNADKLQNTSPLKNQITQDLPKITNNQVRDLQAIAEKTFKSKKASQKYKSGVSYAAKEFSHSEELFDMDASIKKHFHKLKKFNYPSFHQKNKNIEKVLARRINSSLHFDEKNINKNILTTHDDSFSDEDFNAKKNLVNEFYFDKALTDCDFLSDSYEGGGNVCRKKLRKLEKYSRLLPGEEICGKHFIGSKMKKYKNYEKEESGFTEKTLYQHINDQEHISDKENQKYPTRLKFKILERKLNTHPQIFKNFGYFSKHCFSSEEQEILNGKRDYEETKKYLAEKPPSPIPSPDFREFEMHYHNKLPNRPKKNRYFAFYERPFSAPIKTPGLYNRDDFFYPNKTQGKKFFGPFNPEISNYGLSSPLNHIEPKCFTSRIHNDNMRRFTHPNTFSHFLELHRFSKTPPRYRDFNNLNYRRDNFESDEKEFLNFQSRYTDFNNWNHRGDNFESDEKGFSNFHSRYTDFNNWNHGRDKFERDEKEFSNFNSRNLDYINRNSLEDQNNTYFAFLERGDQILDQPIKERNQFISDNSYYGAKGETSQSYSHSPNSNKNKSTHNHMSDSENYSENNDLEYLFVAINDEAKRLQICYDQNFPVDVAEQIRNLIDAGRKSRKFYKNRENSHRKENLDPNYEPSIKTTKKSTNNAFEDTKHKKRFKNDTNIVIAAQKSKNEADLQTTGHSFDTAKRTRGRPTNTISEIINSSDFDDLGMKLDIKRGFVDFDDSLFLTVMVAGEREYACPEPNCGKSFPSLSRVKRHYIVHTGYKPFKCLNKSCTKSFSRKDNMLQHYRAHCEQNKSKL